MVHTNLKVNDMVRQSKGKKCVHTFVRLYFTSCSTQGMPASKIQTTVLKQPPDHRQHVYRESKSFYEHTFTVPFGTNLYFGHRIAVCCKYKFF